MTTRPIAYARFGSHGTLTNASDSFGLAVPTLVLDVCGEFAPPILRDRFTGYSVPFRPECVILRGVSSFLRQDIVSGVAQRALEDAFGAPLDSFELRFNPRATFVPINGASRLETLGVNADEVASACSQIELHSLAVWSEAVWTQVNGHFVLPSGFHADKFVRAGDIFADPVNLSRVADWIMDALGPAPILVADNHSMLPLLQEIQLRMVASGQPMGSKYIVPSYGTSEEEFVALAFQIASDAERTQGSVALLLSALGTGSYLEHIKKAFAKHGLSRPTTEHVLFSTREAPFGGELCHLRTETFANRDSCDLCRVGSVSIPIDERRFTTRIGTVTLKLPTISWLEDVAFTIIDLAAHGALRVHRNRADRHKHLTIFIDTAAALKSEVFLARATIGWARCLHGFPVDLVVVPAHDGTGPMVDWLASKGIEKPLIVDLDAPQMPVEDKARLASARRIVLCDDAVVTGQAMSALREVVQYEKHVLRDEEYEVRGFVLLARPATADLWAGIRSRFFVKNQVGLYSGWELFLPDTDAGGQGPCPWCDELSMLERSVRDGGLEDSGYIHERIMRLRDSEGLADRLLLASEAVAEQAGGDAATHATGGSYLGNMNDVAAFVAAAAIIQKMRNEWNASPERWSRRYSLPLNAILQRFTDPVIAAPLLRVARSHELSDLSDLADLLGTLRRIGHPRQHPVLAAELLLAQAQRKLPSTPTSGEWVDRLRTLPEPARNDLASLFAQLLHLGGPPLGPESQPPQDS